MKPVLIKFGGAALTNKNKRKESNQEHIKWASETILSLYKLHGKIIIVHGAGSFGHFEAKEYELDKGIHHKRANIGIGLTRASVLELNQILINNLLKLEVPCTTISPFSHYTSNSSYNVDLIKNIENLLELGIIPVLHGDVIFNKENNCTILSGDKIMEHISKSIRCLRCIFVSDVHGIYEKPPTIGDDLEGKGLIKEIKICDNLKMEFNKLEQDVTGGIQEKFQS